MEWANVAVQGVLLGGLYALFASGLSLAFGVMRTTNLAHGDLSVLAAYLAMLTAQATGLSPLLATLAVVPVFFVLGYALQRGLLGFTVGKDPLLALLLTFGLSIVIQNGLLEVFSADNRGLRLPRFEGRSLDLGGGLVVGVLPLATFVVAGAVLLGLKLLLSRTRLGRALRATADDPETATLMGIHDRHLYAIALGMAMASAAVAGIFLGLRTTFAPTSGPQRLLFAFEAVVIGGLGNLWGTFLGGIVLGVAQTAGAHLHTGGGVLAGHLVFLALLAVRPSGLWPGRSGA